MTYRRCWCGGTTDTIGGSVVCTESEFHDPLSTGRPDVVRRLYVAGPMTGYPECNYPEFARVALQLRKAGYEVVDPSSMKRVGGHYTDILREDLIGLLGCDAVAFHGDWWESIGARNEIQVAGLLRMPCRVWTDWITLAYTTSKENSRG